jgi:tRNA (guanine-N7-)-methyltransferase
MSRKKQQRMQKVVILNNVFSINDENIEEKLKIYFGNSNPFTLEIGCGQGDYTIEMAKLHPEKNIIGVDYKGARIYSGATRASELNLNNAAFLVAGAEILAEVFSANSIEEIYIPFPDPHKTRKSFKRLVNKNFLNIYKSIILKDAKGHLKTDNDELYKFALSALQKENYIVYFSTSDLYSEDDLNQHHLIQTRYEKQYLSEGKKIKYICFGWN